MPAKNTNGRPLPPQSITSRAIPKRWIVERIFAWLMRYHRLRSEYETTVASSIGWIYAAAIHRMVRHLAPA